MKFREIVDSPCGLRYCFDNLDLQSGLARRNLLEQEMMTSPEAIEESQASLKRFAALLGEEPRKVETLQMKLQSLRDISGTLGSLEAGNILDDIELFEIKHLAMLGEEVSRLLADQIDVAGLDFEYEKVIDLLDPEGQRMGTFYIYDAYSPELREARRALEAEPESDELKDAVMNIEDAVKQRLSGALSPFAGALRGVMNALSDIDLGIAKALQMKTMELIIPQCGSGTSFKGMFNPEVSAILRSKGKSFQKVDFDYAVGSTSTVIGANMGGKTVAMKTLCLAQYLFQFGFAVPALEAVMTPYEKILFCIGDEQSQQKGLSSFAAEILRINNVIVVAEKGVKLLALIDEPARTTNPVEGSALVSALLKILSGKENLSLILTTHYRVEYSGQCWRVKGLQGGSAGLKMDYQLLKTSSNEVPHEALNIARELHVSDWWINEANIYLNTETH